MLGKCATTELHTAQTPSAFFWIFNFETFLLSYLHWPWTHPGVPVDIELAILLPRISWATCFKTQCPLAVTQAHRWLYSHPSCFLCGKGCRIGNMAKVITTGHPMSHAKEKGTLHQLKNSVIIAERAPDFDGHDHFRRATKQLSYWLFLGSIMQAIEDLSSQVAESTQQVSAPVDLTRCPGLVPSTYSSSQPSERALIPEHWILSSDLHRYQAYMQSTSIHTGKTLTSIK